VADLGVVLLADGVIALADVGRDVNVLRQALDRHVDGLDRGRHLAVVAHGEQRLVDLDVLAARFGQKAEIEVQQLAEIGHHSLDVVVVFVKRDLGQHVRSGHRDLDRPPGQRRHHLEFVDQAEIDVVVDVAAAGRRRMEHVRIVGRDRLRLGAALERRDALPEIVQHGVGRRVPVVSAPMHLAAGHHVDVGQLLVEDGGLAGAVLCIRQRGHRKLSERHQAVERLVPVRHAVRADHGGGVLRIRLH
jgi:hypothetical protein